MSLEKREYYLADNIYEIYILIEENGTFWFKANEIAQILQYSNINDAILKHVKEYYRQPFYKLNYTLKLQVPGYWKPHTIFINESGLYQLMFNSKKPEATVFREWATSKLLPDLKVKSIKLYDAYLQDEHNESYYKDDKGEEIQQGYIYIATTKTLQLEDIYKIGKSTYSNIKDVATELNSHLFNDDFIIFFYVKVDNIHMALNFVISALCYCRIFNEKCWFKSDLKHIIGELQSLDNILE